MTRMRGACPRCQAAFDTEVEPSSFFICPSCGAKLRSRGSAPKPKKPAADTARFRAVVAPAAEEVANQDLDGTVRIDLKASDLAAPEAQAPAKPNPPAPQTAEAPATPSPPPSQTAGASADEPALGPDSPLPELMHALYEVQKQTLELVRSRLGPDPATGSPPEIGTPLVGEGFAAYPAPPTRARRRKTVLLVDDDETGRDPAVAALRQAKIPVRTAADTREALAAISSEMPDIIVLEPDLSSEGGARDLIDNVKATTAWSHIPIVLYMRERAESQKETRAAYGADRLILKGPRGPAALVSQVITLFRGV